MYNSTVVTTTYGPVRGRIDRSGVVAFKGGALLDWFAVLAG